jgi:hypothetical protein
MAPFDNVLTKRRGVRDAKKGKKLCTGNKTNWKKVCTQHHHHQRQQLHQHHDRRNKLMDTMEKEIKKKKSLTTVEAKSSLV